MKGTLRPGLVFTSLILFTSLSASVSLQTPTFRTRTDLVQIDVSVLDKNRRPVRGLTQADFTVLEDAKPQPITIFEPHDVPDPEPPSVAWMRDVTPDVTTNETRATRLWVIAIDDALIPTDPWIIKSSKKIVEDIIAKFGPEDLATIVFTADSRKAQDFTSDKTKLLATLGQFNPGFATWAQGEDNTRPPIDGDLHFMIGSIATVLNVVNTLAAVPHNHKSLIWVTPGVPYDFEVAAAPMKAPNYAASNIMGGQDAHLRIQQLTKEIFETARLASVPIYPIDPCGLKGLAAYISRGTVVVDPPKATRSMDHILMTAANTGGHAIVNTNDFTPGINSIFEENKSYYLIGYNPTNINVDGTLRKIEVKVDRENVDVRTESGYYAPKPKDIGPRTTNETLARAVAAPVPVADLPLRATVAPFAIPGGRNAAVAIALGVRQPVPEAAAKERVVVTTDLQVTAFTTEGDNRGTQRTIAKVTLRQGAQGDADYEALSRIDLPPGRYRLRLAAYHEAAAKTGTVMVDVIVPDFGRDAASISGVVLSATPGRPSAPRNLFKDILPIVPTAQRAFAAKDQVTALFDLYQNAGNKMVPAQVAIRVVDGVGVTLINDAQTVAIDRFVAAQTQKETPQPTSTVGGTKSIPTMGSQPRPPDQTIAPLRAAEFQYRLPLDRLPAGPYLIAFEATMGAAVLRRDVQFTVK